MLWVAAFLALIIWVLGLASDFLGLRIHLFLLCAILCGLAALLPARGAELDDGAGEPAHSDAPNANSVPGEGAQRGVERPEPAAPEQGG